MLNGHFDRAALLLSINSIGDQASSNAVHSAGMEYDGQCNCRYIAGSCWLFELAHLLIFFEFFYHEIKTHIFVFSRVEFMFFMKLSISEVFF